MILYADTSALVKKYVREAGTDQVLTFFAGFKVIGTAALTQAEMAAAMTKAVRQGWVDEATMLPAWNDFLSHWPTYTHLPISARTIECAAGLAWQHGLRAYDALHLACAVVWKDVLREETVFACFDKRLHRTAQAEGLQIWPETVSSQ